jgi:hypothetical protein
MSRRNQPARLHIERLEDRLAPSISVRSGVLSVVGTPQSDKAIITLKPGDASRLLVTLNGETQRFVADRIDQIRVTGGASRDLIEIDQSNGPILIPTMLNGQRGNDTIIGGGAADVIQGGDGVDVIRGQAGIDRIDGGRGDDDIDGGGGLDEILGGLGEDTFVAAEDGTGELRDTGVDMDSVRITLDQAPPAVQDAVAANAGDGKLIAFAKEYDEILTFFDAEFILDGVEQSVRLTPDGVIAERVTEVDPNSLPIMVARALRHRHPTGAVERADFRIAGNDREFEVELAVRGRVRDIVVAPDGTIRDDSVEPPDPADRDRFRNFTATGRSQFASLTPGHTLILEGLDDGEQVRLVITVLDALKVIDGVITRVIEEREFIGGELFEVAKNYFVLDEETQNLCYFGEDVDFYEGGRIVGHAGTWRSGVRGAMFGVLLPGRPSVGMTFQQESAPTAQDIGEIMSTTATVATPAGTFTDVVVVRETTPLEPDAEDFKYYAPGIGLIQSNTLQLVSYTLV